MDEQQKQQKIKSALESGMSVKDLAQKLFVTEKQLKILLNHWKIELPRRREYKQVPMPDRKNLMLLYKKLGTTPKVAEYFGVGVNTVNRWMKELKIPTRRMKMSNDEKTKFLEDHIALLDNINL